MTGSTDLEQLQLIYKVGWMYTLLDSISLVAGATDRSHLAWHVVVAKC